VLDEARGLIAQAEEARVERQAPATLANAKRLLAQAEQEIVRNRYDTDLPRSLAQQAEYEARHGLYLAELIQRVADEKFGIENLILAWEQPLRQMAGEVDLVPRFDEGYAPTMQKLLEHVRDQQRRVRQLERDIADRDAQIAALTSEMDRLQGRLGGVSEERIALQRRVDAQARLRANLASVEGMFAADEARVLREGDDVVLRLMGLNFPSGKATIEPASFALLGKVQDAIRLFAGASVIIEGHTDSYGSDSANFILSQDRADAVRQYLIRNMGLDAEAVSSIGYGETRPVATNDTAEGRSRNRRIDLVIRLDASQFD
jgi:outer membrane protein OmpA-like peptidoglycan-associated protein